MKTREFYEIVIMGTKRSPIFRIRVRTCSIGESDKFRFFNEFKYVSKYAAMARLKEIKENDKEGKEQNLIPEVIYSIEKL